MSTNWTAEKKTKADRLFDLLSDLQGHHTTEVSAKEIVGFNLGARLLELRRRGYQIETRRHGKSGSVYRLLSLTPGLPSHKKVRVMLDVDDARAILGGTITSEAKQAVEAAVASYMQSDDLDEG